MNTSLLLSYQCCNQLWLYDQSFLVCLLFFRVLFIVRDGSSAIVYGNDLILQWTSSEMYLSAKTPVTVTFTWLLLCEATPWNKQSKHLANTWHTSIVVVFHPLPAILLILVSKSRNIGAPSKIPVQKLRNAYTFS